MAHATPLFLELPVELFDMIMDYYPEVTVLHMLERMGRGMDTLKLGFQRTAVLRALSQTCRALRRACVPLLWKYADTMLISCYHEKGWIKKLSTRIRTYGQGLFDQPYLAQHIWYGPTHSPVTVVYSLSIFSQPHDHRLH